MGDDDLGRLDRLAVMVADSDLALGVRPQCLFRPGVARLRDRAQDLVRVIERRRHVFRRLAAGVAEHDALVAGALVLVAGGVDALGDVGGLRVQQHFDIGVAPVETLLLVADVLDRLANGRIDLVTRDFRPADLAGDDDAIGRRQGLAGDADLIGIDARLRPFAEEEIDDFIRNSIANLVRVPFGHGFTGELVILTSHIANSPAGAPAPRPCAASRVTLAAQAALLPAGVRCVKPNLAGSFALPNGRTAGVIVSRRQRNHQINDPAAHPRVANTQKGAIELEALGRSEEVHYVRLRRFFRKLERG